MKRYPQFDPFSHIWKHEEWWFWGVWWCRDDGNWRTEK